LKPIPKKKVEEEVKEEEKVEGIRKPRWRKPEEETEQEVELKPTPKPTPEEKEVPAEEAKPEEIKPEEVKPAEEQEKPKYRREPKKPEEPVPEEKLVQPWRKKRTRIDKPVPGRPADEQPAEEEEKPELIPTQVSEEKVEDVVEEVRSQAQVTLLKPKEQKPAKKEKVPLESQDIVEGQQTWRKEMTVETQSKLVQRTAGQYIQDDQPLRDLEIVTAKRGVDKLPEEPVVEDVQVHEDTKTVRRSVVMKSKKSKPPKFTKRLEPVIAEDGKPTKFVCEVEGVPFPELTWYRNGVELVANEEVFTTVVESTVTLEFAKATPQYVGNYSCRASNPAGVATSTANLVVLGTSLWVLSLMYFSLTCARFELINLNDALLSITLSFASGTIRLIIDLVRKSRIYAEFNQLWKFYTF